jgi:hypothetical protein
MFPGKKLFGILRLAELVGSFGARNAFVDGLTARKSFFRAVPVGDGVLAHLPAQQDHAAFDFTGEIKQADIQIFDLNADGVDFGESIFGALFGLGALGLAAGDGNHVDAGSAVEEDALIERLHLRLDFLDEVLAADRRSQQRFQHREQGLSFVESEGAVGHEGCCYFSAFGARAGRGCRGSLGNNDEGPTLIVNHSPLA